MTKQEDEQRLEVKVFGAVLAICPLNDIAAANLGHVTRV